MKALFAIAGLIALGGSLRNSTVHDADDRLSLIAGYRGWARVTAKPVVMDPGLALSCVGPIDAYALDTHAHEMTRPQAEHVPGNSLSAEIPGPQAARVAGKSWSPARFAGFRVFHVYANALGSAAMTAKGAPVFPVGSVIVKEKFFANDFKKGDFKTLPKPELLTVMVKRKPGSNPGVGDWEFFVIDGKSGSVEAGSVKHCENCHESQAKEGYVFRHYGSETLSATYQW